VRYNKVNPMIYSKVNLLIYSNCKAALGIMSISGTDMHRMLKESKARLYLLKIA